MSESILRIFIIAFIFGYFSYYFLSIDLNLNEEIPEEHKEEINKIDSYQLEEDILYEEGENIHN